MLCSTGCNATLNVQIPTFRFLTLVFIWKWHFRIMCVCESGALERVALRWPFLFSLCFLVLSSSPPLPNHVIVFCINPLPSLRASRRLVRSFFSFVTPFVSESDTYWNTRTQKRRFFFSNKGQTKGVVLVQQLKGDSKKEAITKRSACVAECIDCIVRPCVQNPWYCLQSPINVFCMVWSCCHGDPRIGRLKRGNVCMEGVGEKEKGARLLTDGLTAAWLSVCSCLLICSGCDIIELAVFLSLATFSVFVVVFLFVCLPPLPCHHICSSCCIGWKCCACSEVPTHSFVLEFCLVSHYLAGHAISSRWAK